MGDIHPLSLPIADNVRNVLPIRRNALIDERPAAVLRIVGERCRGAVHEERDNGYTMTCSLLQEECARLVRAEVVIPVADVGRLGCTIPGSNAHAAAAKVVAIVRQTKTYEM